MFILFETRHKITFKNMIKAHLQYLYVIFPNSGGGENKHYFW